MTTQITQSAKMAAIDGLAQQVRFMALLTDAVSFTEFSGKGYARVPVSHEDWNGDGVTKTFGPTGEKWEGIRHVALLGEKDFLISVEVKRADPGEPIEVQSGQQFVYTFNLRAS